MRMEVCFHQCSCREQKFHSSARNYELNLERTSNSSQSTHPIGRVLWEELLEGEGEKSEG